MNSCAPQDRGKLYVSILGLHLSWLMLYPGSEVVLSERFWLPGAGGRGSLRPTPPGMPVFGAQSVHLLLRPAAACCAPSPPPMAT